MLPVEITIWVRGKVMRATEVKDRQVSGALRELAGEVGRKLSPLKCPEHGGGPTAIRVHVGADGNADLKYESCCTKLRDLAARALG